MTSSEIPKIKIEEQSSIFFYCKMSHNQVERKVFDYQDTEILDDYPVESIRIVKVPHMSSFTKASDDIPNIRTNVGVAGEE